MFHPDSPKLSLCPLALVIAGAAVLSLSGCALNSTSGPSLSSVGSLQGTMLGGETPILGANIILWETDNTNSGYGLTAKQLATTTTGANGLFSITSNYTCDAGQFLYLTGTGGDVTNGSASPIYNLNEVQIVALGSCSNFGTSTAKGNVNIVLNEVSTVAAAYTLDNFMTVTASSTGHQLVYIGAPAANNATTGACTGTGSSMSCVAAGLSHAFANALNLTDSVHFNGTTPTGLALQAIPGNAQASVPQAQIHMLANALQYCTNSAGGAAPAGTSDGSNCGNFFAAAAPSTSNVPTDTLSALVDIAQNPRHNPATIYAFVPATGAAFQPTLSTAPTNTSIPVTYTGNFVGTSATLVYPSFLTLDANDNVYIIATNAASSAATTGGVVAMTSSGQYLWANAQSAQYCSTGALATDTIGNVWMVNGPTSSTAIGGCWSGITGFATSKRSGHQQLLTQHLRRWLTH